MTEENSSSAPPAGSAAKTNPSSRRRRRYSGRRWKPAAQLAVAQDPNAASAPAPPAPHLGHPAEFESGEERPATNSGTSGEDSVSNGEPAEQATAESAKNPEAAAGQNLSTAGNRRRRRRRGGRGRKNPAVALAPSVAGPEPATPTEKPTTLEEQDPAPIHAADSQNSFFERLEQQRAAVHTRGLRFPGIDAGRAKTGLIAFLREQLAARGMQKCILGLEGGFHDTVAAALVATALGRDKLQLIYFQHSRRQSGAREQASQLARHLRCLLEIRDLQPFLTAAYEGRDQEITPVRMLLRLQREQESCLQDLSLARHACVIHSSSKTERLLGLDCAPGWEAAVNPLGDMYHSQIMELSRALSLPGYLLPTPRLFDEIVEQQTGEKPGISWREADTCLYQMVDLQTAMAYLQNAGAEEHKLHWLYQRLRQNHCRPPVVGPAVEFYAGRTLEKGKETWDASKN